MTALFAAPLLLIVLSVSVWALLEPALPQANDHKLNCEYAQQQKRRPDAPNYPVLLCDRGDAESSEYPAYTAVKRGEANAVFPAFRHWFNGIVRDPVSLFTGILALSTIFLWLSTRRLWRGAEAQARDFKRSVEASGRFAVAMEGVDKSMAANVVQIVQTVATNKKIAKRQKRLGQMQLRAYLSVVINSAAYQDRATNWKFEGKPMLVNSGATPAHKIKYVARAAVLPVPLPIDADLSLPSEDDVQEGMIPPNQNRIMSAMVEEYIPDDQVSQTMRMDGQALYTWGVITYEDAFGQKRRTEFCHQIGFMKKRSGDDWTVHGYYVAGRNTAT